MKKIFTIAGLIFLGWSANAQSPDNNLSDSTQHHNHYRQWDHRGNDSLRPRPHAFNQNRGESMRRFHSREGFANRVHYTPEQRKQIQAINADYRKKADDLFSNDNMTLKEYKSGLLALQKEKKGKLQALMTQEQKDQIAKWKKQAAENAQVRAAARLERMKLKLKLSDQQVATIQSKQSGFRDQMKAIYENDNLLPYQKKEQMKELAMNEKNAIKSVLTPDQLSMLEDMHKQRFRER